MSCEKTMWRDRQQKKESELFGDHFICIEPIQKHSRTEPICYELRYDFLLFQAVSVLTLRNGTSIPHPISNEGWTAPDGGLFSSPNDMSKLVPETTHTQSFTNLSSHSKMNSFNNCNPNINLFLCLDFIYVQARRH
jgi:hypothetical protein